MGAKDMYRAMLNLSVKLFGAPFTKKADARIRFHKKIDLKNPTTLSDKLCYLELFVDNPLKVRCTDKYDVREYVKSKGLADILIPLCHDVCSSVDDIQFEMLPQKFIMKATHGCGMNYICEDKSKASKEQIMRIAQEWLNKDYQRACIEPHYKKIPHRIQFEELLGGADGITDYKFYCFHGVPDFVLVCTSRLSGVEYYSYTLDWKKLDVVRGHGKGHGEIDKPDKFDQMIEISKTLSSDFDFVRVDLYEVNGKIYFGELTFSPESGVINGCDDEFVAEKGKLLHIDVR